MRLFLPLCPPFSSQEGCSGCARQGQSPTSFHWVFSFATHQAFQTHMPSSFPRTFSFWGSGRVSSHTYANILFRVFCIYIHEQVAFNFPFLFVLDRTEDQGYTGLTEWVRRILTFFLSLRENVRSVLNMFGRIPIWTHTNLEFSLLKHFNYESILL